MFKNSIVLWVSFLPLMGVSNHIFTGARLGGSLGFNSSYGQQASMVNPSTKPDGSSACPNSSCKGDELVGFYTHAKQPSFAFTYAVGDELFFDKLAISGLRIYGTMQYTNATLGERYKVENKGGKNYDPQYIKAIDPTTGNVIPQAVTNGNPPPDGFKNVGGDLAVPNNYSSPCARLGASNPLGLCPTPTPQESLLQHPSNAISLGLNVDFFLNVPIDYWVRKHNPKFLFLKWGVFVGGGVEYTMFWSDRFVNQALGKKTRFFAAGSGFFVNVGTQLYVGKRNRLTLGWKFPYYKFSAQNWYNYGNSNPGTQQTLTQTLSITPLSQFFLGYAYLF
ncbi:outer membrane beta-barrel protein [Helicobacter cynogastricus]|uniref:outer membrane beta-barrel protein n=1 Tax=Helicobacter cynogastricus TaxID=329937 RepID=UPI000CF17222|nr:outer membrane beta-barrel protein [Helicobacter cynogastricus]